MTLYRHGDVMIESAAPIPEEGRTPRHGSVLARGEASGHSHRFRERRAVKLYLYKYQHNYIHVIADTATLVHEEHAPITLKAGWYRYWFQREWDNTDQGAIRRMID